MGRPSKRQKPIFSENVILRRRAKGWNGITLAEKAKIPYPTLRDIEAGISPGLEENRQAIAKALGCSMADLYTTASSAESALAKIEEQSSDAADMRKKIREQQRGEPANVGEMTPTEMGALIEKHSKRDSSINLELERLRKLVKAVPAELLQAWTSEDVDEVQKSLCLYLLTWDEKYSQKVPRALWDQFQNRMNQLGVKKSSKGRASRPKE